MARNQDPKIDAISLTQNGDQSNVNRDLNPSTLATVRRSIIVTVCLEESSSLSESEVLALTLQHEPD